MRRDVGSKALSGFCCRRPCPPGRICTAIANNHPTEDSPDLPSLRERPAHAPAKRVQLPLHVRRVPPACAHHDRLRETRAPRVDPPGRPHVLPRMPRWPHAHRVLRESGGGNRWNPSCHAEVALLDCVWLANENRSRGRCESRSGSASGGHSARDRRGLMCSRGGAMITSRTLTKKHTEALEAFAGCLAASLP